MSFDISPLLTQWEYRPGQIDVRRFKGKDGLEKLQLRVDLGLLQLNVEGRPDGKRPFGHPSLLEHHESRLARHLAEHEGNVDGFRLTAEECSRLQQEAIQFHHRYICLYQLQDYPGVVLDTERNLKVFDFVEQYAETPELAWMLQQFRPQVLMMHARAKGSTATEANDYPAAIEVVQNAMEELRTFYRKHLRPEMIEESQELLSLENWLQELSSKRPMTPREKLEMALQDAVKREDYEQAARVRDSLRDLEA
jgi:hypothetical protein